MTRFLSVGGALLCALLGGCARPKPVLVYESPTVGDGGRLLRNLYRNFWFPPSTDDDILGVGLVPSATQIRFRATERMRIRAWSERSSWEVASPEGVIWKVEPTGIHRPPITAFHGVVQSVFLPKGDRPDPSAVTRWRERGFSSAGWVGPPSMDTDLREGRQARWILSVTPPAGEVSAREVCRNIRKTWHAPCDVYSRVDVPAVASGMLRAENGTFSRPFEGILELVSPYGPVELLDFVPEERTGERTHEFFGPQLVIVPNARGEISVVQSTSLGGYLEGVVPSEIFPGAAAEALRAQAIVARTYSLRQKEGTFSSLPFSICASTNCQVYRGLSLRRPATSSAVRDTHDLVLRESGGDLAETFYHAICGGRTESRVTIWGAPPRHYLHGSSDAADGSDAPPMSTDESVTTYLDKPATSFCGRASLTKSDRWRWIREFDSAALRAIAERLDLSPPLHDIRITRRGASGRVLELEVRSATGKRSVRGELEIRTLLGGLLSSLFVTKVTRSDDRMTSLTVRGAGYGHGVGLCQMGAIGRAEAGQDFRTILQAYFPGLQVAPILAPIRP